MLFLAGLSAPHSDGAIIAAAIAILASAPGLSTMFAGLRVPQLPTAGRDLAVSDELIDDVDARSTQAHFIYEGMCLGICAGAVSAVGYLAHSSVNTPIISTLLCLIDRK